MKTGFTFALLMLLTSFFLAQNAMFVPFGQTSGELRNYFSDKSYLKASSYEEKSISHKVSSIQKVTYHLKNSILFATEDSRLYEDKKLAEHIIGTCIGYMERENRKAHVMESRGGTTRYASVEADRIIELFVEKNPEENKRAIKLTLKVTSRFYGPRMQTEEMASEIARKGIN